MTARRSDTDLPAWMGKYPRKGADWSPEEDQALMHAYESGRYLTRDIAACHMRETVAIEWRIETLRRHAVKLRAAQNTSSCGPAMVKRDWQTERETAKQAGVSIKEEFPKLWPIRPKGKSMLAGWQVRTTVRDNMEAYIVYIAYAQLGMANIGCIALADLPPEVAQALQFGQGEES